MADDEGVPDNIQLPMVWVEPDEVPIQFANQFLVQIDEDEIILTIGQRTPPALLGTPRERFEQAQKLEYLPIKTVARFGLTRQRLDELLGLLTRIAENYDKAHGLTGKGGDSDSG